MGFKRAVAEKGINPGWQDSGNAIANGSTYTLVDISSKSGKLLAVRFQQKDSPSDLQISVTVDGELLDCGWEDGAGGPYSIFGCCGDYPIFSLNLYDTVNGKYIMTMGRDVSFASSLKIQVYNRGSQSRKCFVGALWYEN